MLAEYLKRTRAGEPVIATFEEIPEDSDFLRRKEGLMLGLRLSGGVPSSSFEEIRKSLSPDTTARMDDAFLAELLERHAGRVRLTRKGVLLSNEVFSLLV
jgi:coproporphyrinogen III oxidase-like Fe-S oxidoreductase